MSSSARSVVEDHLEDGWSGVLTLVSAETLYYMRFE